MLAKLCMMQGVFDYSALTFCLLLLLVILLCFIVGVQKTSNEMNTNQEKSFL